MQTVIITINLQQVTSSAVPVASSSAPSSTAPSSATSSSNMRPLRQKNQILVALLEQATPFPTPNLRGYEPVPRPRLPQIQQHQHHHSTLSNMLTPQ